VRAVACDTVFSARPRSISGRAGQTVAVAALVRALDVRERAAPPPDRLAGVQRQQADETEGTTSSGLRVHHARKTKHHACRTPLATRAR
jgi:hypothetical protein